VAPLGLPASGGIRPQYLDGDVKTRPAQLPADELPHAQEVCVPAIGCPCPSSRDPLSLHPADPSLLNNDNKKKSMGLQQQEKETRSSGRVSSRSIALRAGRSPSTSRTGNKNTTLIHGDCLAELAKLHSNSVDLVLVDLPYGTTACPWDSVIPLDALWAQLKRISKPKANYVFTAQQPFTWALAASNPEWFRYELIWEKPNGTNPFQAKRMPMKRHENVLVFYGAAGVYNPQMTDGKPYKWNAKRSGSQAGGMAQGVDAPIDNKGTRYPASVLRFPQERGLHPTQKPVPLMEWLVRTYSNEGAVVLDCCMGSGTTGVAAIRANRKLARPRRAVPDHPGTQVDIGDCRGRLGSRSSLRGVAAATAVVTLCPAPAPAPATGPCL
jgi:site-specific DNA-methyltransferase (adenine-specific)